MIHSENTFYWVSNWSLLSYLINSKQLVEKIYKYVSNKVEYPKIYLNLYNPIFYDSYRINI